MHVWNECEQKYLFGKIDVYFLNTVIRNINIYVDFLIILFIDPCENKPCQNNGKCTAFKDKSGFQCICGERHNGLLCEKGICDILTDL